MANNFIEVAHCKIQVKNVPVPELWCSVWQIGKQFFKKELQVYAVYLVPPK